MKFYYLCRKEDVSHISGTGHVAEVAEFSDGTVAVRWLAAKNAAGVASTAVFDSLADLLKVHGHEGRTIAEPVVDGGHVCGAEERVGHHGSVGAYPPPDEFNIRSMLAMEYHSSSREQYESNLASGIVNG